MFRASLFLIATTVAVAVADTPDEAAFKKYVNGGLGGVWMSKNAQGQKEEAVWKWIAGKAFAQLSGKSETASWEEIHGIDPATGRWTYWGFDSDGRTWKGTASSPKQDEYIFQEAGQGPKGAWSGKYQVIVTGADKGRSEQLENVLDGKKMPPEPPRIWTRKK